ncbi:MAG: C39 family peptidase [Alphaproteobacteria bacterium]|nr:C39 family peptidase [Alphaproteobacteria bacterium]MBV9377683.1 C39 family peptidase [Alphaproteobacteria bacterium]
MNKHRIWPAACALAWVALLLCGCGFGRQNQWAQYAASHSPREPYGESEDISATAASVPAPAAAAYFDRSFQAAATPPRPVQSLLETRHHGVIIQSWDLSCGAAALATLLKYEWGEPVTEKQVANGLISRREYIENPNLVQIREGFSLLDLKRYVEVHGFKGEGLGQLDFNDLVENAPIMVPVNALGYNHFVIFRGIMRDRVLLADPAWGNRTMTTDKFQRMWLDYGKEMGHVGFVVKRADGSAPINRLGPKATDFVMFD